MIIFEVVFEYNEILQIIYLTFTHLTCIALQPHNFQCQFSNLKDENLYYIYIYIYIYIIYN
jgi:hypothetical protein